MNLCLVMGKRARVRARHFLLSASAVAVAAIFAMPADAATKSFTGASGGSWFEPTNWSPEGVPTADDDVTVNAKTVNAVGDLVAGSVSLAGAAVLNIGNSATRAKVMDDPPVRTNVSATITGDLTLANASKLYVFSGRLADTNVFDGANARGQAYTNAMAALWTGANRISIGGAFTVDGNSFVYPDFEPITGTPVVFVCGSFHLGEGSTVSTVQRGWDWSNGEWATHPAGSLPLYKEPESSINAKGWTYAFAPARTYHIGAGYGGDGQQAKTYSGYLFGKAYGYSFAPFLSGSPSCAYRPINDGHDDCRGSGSFVVYAATSLTVNGTINAYGYDSRDYSGASGGGIWLATGGEEVTFGAAAKLYAYGANATFRGQSLSYNANGGGGRVAVAQGVSQAQWNTLASGVIPDGFNESSDIIGPEIRLEPGYNGKVSTPLAQSGTVSLVQSVNADIFMNVVLAGEGTVEYAGTAYTTNFLVKVPANTAITLTALGTGTSTFVAWHSQVIPGGEALTPAVSVTGREMFTVSATFASSTRTTRTWNGSLSDSWRNGANWTPAGAPGTNDDLVFSARVASLPQGTNTFGSITLSAGAILNIGDSDTRPGGAALVTVRDLVIQGGAKLQVYAPELSDTSAFADARIDPSPIYPALWNAAAVVKIGGDLTVTGSGSAIVSDAAPVTGVPVVFRVGGDFEVGEGATVDGKNRGWMWVDGAAASAPAGYKPRRGNNALKENGWTFAPGAGLDYYNGGAYGGYATNRMTLSVSYQNCRYSSPYGHAFAPFLPGSPAGWFRGWGLDGKTDVGQSTLYPPTSFRAGGQVVVLAGGEARIDGTITAACTTCDYAGSSGGGIWLAAADFVFGENALLDAHGGDKIVNNYEYCPGSGGRIALAEGMTAAQLDSCAAGALPAGFADWGAPDGVNCNVKCGIMRNGSIINESFVDDGTVAWLRSAPVQVSVAIDGAGSIAVAGGESHTTNFTLTVAAGTALTLTATADVRFDCWSGDVPGGTNTYTQTVTFDVVRTGMSVAAVMPTGPFTRTWTGAAGDGNLANQANYAPSDYPITSADALVFNSGSLTITNDFTAHSITLNGSAALKVVARPTEGPCDPASLYAAATVVSLPGGLLLDGSSTLTVEADKKTGAAVRFDVGDFTLAQNAKINAKQLGWGWFEGEDERALFTNATASATYESIAPGTGHSYGIGGGYGGYGGCEAVLSQTHGKAYGYALAPFLPGSPNGIYNNSFANAGRGGGAVWIRANGIASVDGHIDADGGVGASIYGSSSGGGVWISAAAFRHSNTGRITADGGSIVHAYRSSGAGGRIAFAVGLSDAEYAALAAGATPESVTAEESIDLVDASALGGQTLTISDGHRFRAPSGTLRTAYGSAERRVVVVTGADGIFADAAENGVEPAYGAWSYAKGEELPLFAAPAYGIDPQDPNRRYTADGYELRDASGALVASGDGQTVQIPAAEGPLFLSWKWTSPECRLAVSCPDNATLKLDGVAVAGDIDVWAAEGSSRTIEVFAAVGYEFLCWTKQIPLGAAFDNPACVPVGAGRVIGAVVRAAAEPTTRQWRSSASDDWTVASNWSPAGLPGHEDAIEVTAGTMLLTESLRVAALTIHSAVQTSQATGHEVELSVTGDLTSTGGRLQLGVQDVAAHARLSVGGDMTMSGASVLRVYAGPVDDEFGFASGCSFVDVAGTFELADTASFEPYSQRTDGGSVKTTCGRFVLGENAKVNAIGKGYAWIDAVVKPDCVGTGWDYQPGAAYAANHTISADLASSGKFSPNDLDWGRAYGYRMAPIHPGAANGSYQSDAKFTSRGGGLVRIHAGEMSIAGQVLANAGSPSYTANLFGGAAGGGIWLTADAFDFAATAVLSVKGGNTKYGPDSVGGGGRIAIGEGLLDKHIETLAATGECPGLRRSALRTNEKSLANFAAKHPGATVVIDSGDTKNGAAVDADRGSFEFYAPRGGMFIMR